VRVWVFARGGFEVAVEVERGKRRRSSLVNLDDDDDRVRTHFLKLREPKNPKRRRLGVVLKDLSVHFLHRARIAP
jgi:hypothetical protein